MKHKTPLLRPLRDKGATMYVFPSAQEDIGLNLNSRATGAALSHYALLNIPMLNFGSSVTNPNEALAEEFQNYIMNFETLLLNEDSYNYQDYHTVSERVFWHWVTKNELLISFNKSGNYLVESGNTDDRLVTCFGAIDAGNSLTTEFGMFNETYINIPTSYGNGPVFFKQCQTDSNYIIGKDSYTSKESASMYLLGRSDNKSTYLEKNDAIYDFGNSYQTTQGDIEGIEIVKNILDILIALLQTNNSISINSYDDVNINLAESNEFKFNAILLYYSIYDLDNPSKAPYAINLFGIIFLNGLTKVNTGFYIEPFIKKKSTDSYFGNSYSFRVNVKTMSVYDDTDAVINDNTTLSSISSFDFSDVISNLNRAIDVMNTNVHTTMSILDAYMQIRTYYDDLLNNIKDLSTKLNSLINGSPTTTFDTSTLTSNLILPSNKEQNNLLILVYTEYSDLTDSDNNTDYTDSVYVKNTYNIPGFYYPLVNIDKEFNEHNNIVPLLGSIASSVIKGTNVVWYSNKNKGLSDDTVFTYPIIVFDDEVLVNNNFKDLKDSSGNINYNLLLACMLDYLHSVTTPELTDDDINKIIENIHITDEVINPYIENLSTRIANNTNTINNNYNTLNNLITTANKSVTDLSTYVHNMPTSGSGSGVSNVDIIDIRNDIRSLRSDITNNTNSINLLDTSIKNNIKDISINKAAINDISTNLSKVTADVADIKDKLKEIDIVLNAHKDSLQEFKNVVDTISLKLNEMLTWKEER